MLAQRCGRAAASESHTPAAVAEDAHAATPGSALSAILRATSAVVASTGSPAALQEALERLSAAGGSSGSAAVPVAALCRAQQFVAAGQLAQAADCIAASTSCSTPAAASAVAALRAAAGDSDGAVNALTACVAAHSAGEAVNGLATALCLRAGLYAALLRPTDANADYAAVAALAGAGADLRAAALASSAVVTLQVGCI